MSKIESEYDNSLVLCELDGKNFEVRRFVLPYIVALAMIDKPEDLIVLVEVSEGLITNCTHSPLPWYKVDWNCKENEECPVCGIDGIRYEDKFCPQCLFVFDIPDDEYLRKFLVHSQPFDSSIREEWNEKQDA